MTPFTKYSAIRGAGYRLTDAATAARDLGYGRKIGLNHLRVSLDCAKNSPAYWDEARALLRTAHALGYTADAVLLDARHEALSTPEALSSPQVAAWI